MLHYDPRDSGTPFAKEWHEFEAAYASARLQGWLLDELEELRPGYFEDLRTRIVDAVLNAEILAKGGLDNPEGPIQSPSGRGAEFRTLDELNTLEQQLFPFGEPQTDFTNFARGLVLVGLHAALEVYCSALGITKPRTPLPISIEKALASRGQPLDGTTSRALVTCDETRHLYAHNHGVVDQRYIDNAPYNKFQLRERRPVTVRDLEDFAQTVWKVAVRAREAFTPGQAT